MTTENKWHTADCFSQFFFVVFRWDFPFPFFSISQQSSYYLLFDSYPLVATEGDRKTKVAKRKFLVVGGLVVFLTSHDWQPNSTRADWSVICRRILFWFPVFQLARLFKRFCPTHFFFSFFTFFVISRTFLLLHLKTQSEEAQQHPLFFSYDLPNYRTQDRKPCLKSRKWRLCQRTTSPDSAGPLNCTRSSSAR